MKLQWMLIAAAATAPWSGFYQEGTEQEPLPEARRGLVKAAPAQDLDAAGWRARLTDPDLDRREREFDALVREVGDSPAAEQALRDWARGSDELAWTARLALRELEGAGGPLRAWGRRGRLDPFEVFRFDPFGRGGDPFEDLRREFDQLLEGLDARGRSWNPASPPGARSSGRSVRLESTPEGVEVIVEETTDGRTERRVYQAETLEELYAAHPELEGEVGLRIGAGAPPPGGVAPPPGLRRPGSEVTRTDILGAYLRAPSAQALEGDRTDLGLEVQSTVPGTLAAALRLSAGDVLLRLNGVRLLAIEDVKRALDQRLADEEVALEVLGADGERETLTWSPGG